MLKVFAGKTRLVFFARRMTAEAGTQRINHDEDKRVSWKKITSVRFIGCNVSVEAL